MPSPPDAPNDPASDATSRIGDILASAEREVADIIAAAERRSAAEHDARSRTLDARAAELDEREAQLGERDAALAALAGELDARATHLTARATRVQERADELDDIGTGLVQATIGLHEHARRLGSLTPLGEDDEDPAGPAAPTAIRRLLPPVAVPGAEARDTRASSPTGLRAVAPAVDHERDRIEAERADAEDDDTGHADEVRGRDARGQESRDHDARGQESRDRETRDGEPLVARADDDWGPDADQEAPQHDAVPSGEPEDPRIRAAETRTSALPALHVESSAQAGADDAEGEGEGQGGTSPSGPSGDDGEGDSPDKIDSARLVALSMAAEGRPRDDVEAYIRDELKIRDHAALIDYVFGISTPSSVVPSWPPRRRRRT